jgi:hypothetical protein
MFKPVLEAPACSCSNRNTVNYTVRYSFAFNVNVRPYSEVKPGRHYSPPHRTTFYARVESTDRVWMMWRAISGRPWCKVNLSVDRPANGVTPTALGTHYHSHHVIHE